MSVATTNRTLEEADAPFFFSLAPSPEEGASWLQGMWATAVALGERCGLAPAQVSELRRKVFDALPLPGDLALSAEHAEYRAESAVEAARSALSALPAAN